MRADRTIRVAFALALITGVAALLYFQGFQNAKSAGRKLGFQQSDQPSPGGIRVRVVVPGLPAQAAGLRAGDLIESVDGMAVESDLSYQRAAAHYERGRAVRLHVLRGNGTVDLRVFPGAPFPYADFLVSLVTALAFLGAALLALSQSLRDLRTRLLFGFTVAVAVELALPSGAIGSAWVRAVSLCSWYLLSGLQMGLELHLASLIPERHPWLRGRRWVVPLYYLVGLGLGVASCATYVSDEVLGHPFFPWTLDQSDALLKDFSLPLWGAAVSLLLFRQALRHPEPRGRQQAGLVLAAVLPWFAVETAISASGRLGTSAPEWLERTQSPVLLLFPVAIFAAVYLYNLFDIELVVRRSLIYTTLSGALVVTFYAALAGAGWFFPSLIHGTDSVWAVASAMLLLGLLFAPLRRFVHRLIDRGFFPERHEMRARLIALAGELPALGKLPRMGQHLVTRLAEIFMSRSAILLIASPETGLLNVLATTGGEWQEAEKSLLVPLEDPGIEALRRSSRPLSAAFLAHRSPLFAHRLPGLDATGLAVPLLNHDRLIGVLVVSGKSGGQGYPSEEQDLLNLLAHHVATVFENARLFESATYESLTGLLRREAILEQLDRELERALRYGRPLTLAMADLDYFKDVNDSYGHLAGDTLLKAISQAASQGIRSTDWIGRYGGEEFLLVLPETDMAGAASVAEKIRSLVQKTAVPMDDGSEVRVTISIGLASLLDGHPRGERITARDLIAAADRSLYEAKNTGRNRVFPLVA
ncbi:MAG TPA: diguanylate cyclase [Thermoanaerobaculia bacterium]|nr:diguanylate cyclase [Thermoanaerobaculia bacterium]